MGWSTAPMLFQTGHAVFRAAKAKLDPASPKWTVAALLDENYRATPSFSKNSYLATVPKDFDIEFIKLPDLKNLDPAKYQALVFPPSEKYPTPYIDSIVDYVDRGGHLFLLGGIPFYYQMEYAKESPDELIVKQNGTPGVDRRRFRIAWQTSWSDKTKKTPETAKVVVAPDFRELLKNDPVAGRTKAFLNDKLLGTGDRFIPILLGKEGNFEAPCAAIFQYGDRKGTVVASTIAANEVLTEEDQAAFLPQVILLSRFAGIERFLWYEFRAVEQAVHDKEQFFGIVHRDLKPKPAYLTYTALTRACPDGSVIDTSIPWNRGDFCAIKWMRQDGTSCWAVWAPEEKKTISVKISGKVQAAFDCFGTDVSITEKTTTLEIGRNVLYLIGPTSLEFQVNEIAEATTEKPNVVIIFTDDQGYADVGCYGAKEFKTPHLDQLAREGRRFTNFYVAASVCTPSRAALLTGCYPQRIGLGGFVFFPTRGENPGPGPTGLHPNEITIAEMLKQQGYATACIGKWHLGDAPPFLPTRQGFDEYFGLPYSNDMRNGPNPPLDKRNTYPPLPLYDGEKIIETEPDQTYLTRRYTERAVDFIERHRDQPFFLYLPHTMPHVPLHVHSDFKGKSEQGLYGDVIQEIDWSVGRILQSLKNCGIDEKTWVIFTSDNGPWLTMGKRGGSALPLRDGKQSKYDGGHRVPCLMRFPGQIKAGTVGEEMIASIDLFPTIAKLCGGILPRDRTIDGMDAWDYFSGATERSPRKVYFYNKEVVRQEKWKLFLPGNYAEFRQDKMINPAVVYDKSRLYDLDTDIAETTDVSEQYPNVVRDLKQQLKCYAEDLRLNTRPLAHAKDFTE